MFTGIITHIGTISERIGAPTSTSSWVDVTIGVTCDMDMDTVDMGASIAHNGVCLSVVDKKNTATGGYFAVDVSRETLQKTTIASWNIGTKINLERALKIGDELGGHLVSGHVDTTTKIVRMQSDGDSMRIYFAMPKDFMGMIAPKGSIVINGVSLTLNEVTSEYFGVNIIPHTMQNTTFYTLKTGDMVNLEVDLMARYVAHYMMQKGL